jgi:AcrR family transcriptional regulator
MTGTRRPEQRDALLAGAVEHVLRHGVATLSLRPLAAALGTSDRMLLYWFGSRDRLLTAVLDAVGTQLQAGLRAVLPPAPVTPAVLLASVRQVLDAPEVEGHLRLYVEVSGLATRGREPFRTAVGEVARGWLAWIAQLLDVPDDEREAAAAGVLTVVDGLLLVRFVAGRDTAARAAEWVTDHLR